MLTLFRPTVEAVRRLLDVQQHEPYSYAEVGATQHEPPAGYDFDRHRVLLGYGRARYEEACAALRSWQMFPRPMAHLYWPDALIKPGSIVAVLFRAGPLWSLNPARIVYVVNEASDPLARFGFAYGTLPAHIEQGEERFQVEWHAADNSVWYELVAFSRPRHRLARCAYWYARTQQARFRRLSGLAMQRAMCVSLRTPSSGPPFHATAR